MNKTKIRKLLADFLETLLFAGATCAFIYLVIAIPNQVEGRSMEESFYDNELILTNKTIQWAGQTIIGQTFDYEYKRGDVIIFKSHDTNLIKRIIAKEGDVIMIENNEVYVNGLMLDEKYIPITVRTKIIPSYNRSFNEGETITVPNDSFFVLGDNRENSTDSRFSEIGFISRKDVRGKVFLRYWPLNRFGIIKRGETEEIAVEPTPSSE